MFSRLFYVLTIWTAVSLSIGIVWVTLCYAYDGVEYVKCSRSWEWRNDRVWPLQNAAVGVTEQNPG